FSDPIGADRGVGDQANRGFLRAGSIVVIAMIQQEDDCTAIDPTFYDPAGPVDPNLRCGARASELQPTSRYVDGLSAIVDPHDLVLFEIAGVPPDLVSTHVDPDFDTMLADPRMASGTQACVSATSGTTTAPRRMVTVARDLHARGTTTVIGSLCDGT